MLSWPRMGSPPRKVPDDVGAERFRNVIGNFDMVVEGGKSFQERVWACKGACLFLRAKIRFLEVGKLLAPGMGLGLYGRQLIPESEDTFFLEVEKLLAPGMSLGL